jgi:hypothetical protein
MTSAGAELSERPDSVAVTVAVTVAARVMKPT